MGQPSELHWSEDEAARIVRETYGAVLPESTSTVAESLYDASELAGLPPPVTEEALIEVGRKAGFVDIEVVGGRVPLRKDRLKRYPLFSVEFLD